MTKTESNLGLPPRRSDAEIVAAVGADPDQAPVRTAAGMTRARRDAAERDVLRLRRRLKIGQIELANRYGLALGTLRNWEQGRSAPDRSGKVLLAAIAADPDGVARGRPRRRSELPRGWAEAGRLTASLLARTRRLAKRGGLS